MVVADAITVSKTIEKMVAAPNASARNIQSSAFPGGESYGCEEEKSTMPDPRHLLEEQIKRLKRVQEKVAEAGKETSEEKTGQSRKLPASPTPPTSETA